MSFRNTPLSDQVADLRYMTQPLTHGCKVDNYLQSRGIDLKRFPRDLRQDSNGNMVAVIRDKDGVGVSYQTTLLPVPDKGPRRLMAKGRAMPPGSAIRLHDIDGWKQMGIAEGTETGLSAARLFQVPTWVAINTTGMERWRPPPGIKQLLIFADDDRSFAGERAANNLYDEVVARGIEAQIHKPEMTIDGTDIPRWGDWNDVLKEKQTRTEQEMEYSR